MWSASRCYLRVVAMPTSRTSCRWLMDEDKKEDVQEVVEDEVQEVVEDEEQDIVDDDTAAKRIDWATKELDKAREDLDKADQRLADAQKEKDNDNIKQSKEDVKQCRKYVSECREDVKLFKKHIRKMLNAVQEASSRKRKGEMQRVDDAYKARKDRWDKLNKVLNKRKKSLTMETCDFSYVSWNDVVPIFKPIEELQFSQQELPANINVDDLMKVIKKYNDLTTGSDVSELQVFLFINAVICHICSGFEDLQFNYECDISGSYILASGHFELVMRNKKTKRTICLAEAKKLDLEQGAAQCLIGCETISDHEGSNVVYGIVSSYFQWIFYASKNDGIYRHMTASIGCNGFYPSSREHFELLLKDIYSFISMVLS